MRRWWWVVLLVGLRPVCAGWEPAASADGFVDQIGVCTHWNYPDTPYGYAYDQVKRLLGELGARHVRDGAHPRLLDLYRTYGIRATVLVGPEREQRSPAEQLVRVQALGDAVAMIEAPNEVAIFATSGTYRGQPFPVGARLFCEELYNAVRAHPELSRFKVIAPSTGRYGANLALAPLRCFDYLVMHPYAGGGMPSLSLANPVNDDVLDAGRLLGPGGTLLPTVVTESGYHTAVAGDGKVIAGSQPGVSEAAQAKYLPRHFAEYHNAGIVRTFVYELINEFKDEATNAEASFGLIRRDLTPKPAYHALRKLIGLLGEATWSAAERRWDTPPVAPRALDLTLDAPPTVHHTLLQTSQGAFWLLLWNEVPSFDTGAARDLAPAPVKATVRFTAGTTAELYRLNDDQRMGWGNTRAVTLDVPDEVILLKLTQPRPADTLPPARPTGVTWQATGNRVDLAWTPIDGAAGYFVWRLGRWLGYTAEPRFSDTGLQPDWGYPYEVAAVNAAGNVSSRAGTVALTKAVFPDLQVTEITWQPAAPKAGDEVLFSATIVNRGTGSALPGVVHGVVFRVDGQQIGWSDTHRAPLGPGESVTVTINNGPGGRKTWLATAGEHEVIAEVDDVDRINESDEGNNTLRKGITVGG